jgi:hypothetical protein
MICHHVLQLFFQYFVVMMILSTFTLQTIKIVTQRVKNKMAKTSLKNASCLSKKDKISWKNTFYLSTKDKTDRKNASYLSTKDKISWKNASYLSTKDKISRKNAFYLRTKDKISRIYENLNTGFGKTGSERRNRTVCLKGFLYNRITILFFTHYYVTF